jgi:membrane-associated protease RseP (regulator of RpoE activity)
MIGGPAEYVWHPPQKFRDRVWLHVALFALTILSTTFWGGLHYEAFASDFGVRHVTLGGGALLVRGLWYTCTILAILGCHELGHYLACRYYDVDASLPFFLPFPLAMTGTLGAFIRIREPIPSKRMLFDIGIAGPIAGFVIAVPALFLGMWMSHVVVFPSGVDGFELGEPLLFKLATRLVWGHIADGYTVNMHPVAFGAWFGLLATALNLIPVGQFDGGHISYAVLGRKSSQVTMVMIVGALAGLDRDRDRDAFSFRPAPSAHVRRKRAARFDPPRARPVRAPDVRPVLYARADSGNQAAPVVRTFRSAIPVTEH